MHGKIRLLRYASRTKGVNERTNKQTNKQETRETITYEEGGKKTVSIRTSFLPADPGGRIREGEFGGYSPGRTISMEMQPGALKARSLFAACEKKRRGGGKKPGELAGDEK